MSLCPASLRSSPTFPPPGSSHPLTANPCANQALPRLRGREAVSRVRAGLSSESVRLLSHPALLASDSLNERTCTSLPKKPEQPAPPRGHPRAPYLVLFFNGRKLRHGNSFIKTPLPCGHNANACARFMDVSVKGPGRRHTRSEESMKHGGSVPSTVPAVTLTGAAPAAAAFPLQMQCDANALCGPGTTFTTETDHAAGEGKSGVRQG